MYIHAHTHTPVLISPSCEHSLFLPETLDRKTLNGTLTHTLKTRHMCTHKSLCGLETSRLAEF